MGSFYALSGEELIINQFQAPSLDSLGSSKFGLSGLGWFDHRLVLTRLVAEIAGALGLFKMGILSGKHNYWVQGNGYQGEHSALDRALKIYDQTAVRAGFEPAGEDGVCHGRLG